MTISLDNLQKNPEVASTIRKVLAAGYYIQPGEKRSTPRLMRSEFLCIAISLASRDGLITEHQESECRALIHSILTRGTLDAHLTNTNPAYAWRSHRYGYAAKCLHKLRLAYWENLINILES